MPFADALAATILRWLLVVNAVASIAAALVLAIEPGAIPAAVGVTLEHSQHLMAYLLVAAELSISALCVLALLSKLAATVGQAACVLIVFHVGSAVAGAAAMAEGASPLIGWNVVLRVAMAAALAWSAKRSSGTATGTP
jgi:hypothetical protein